MMFPSEEADAVKTCQRNKCIYYAAYDAFHATENGGNNVKAEKSYKTPVDSTKYY
jgi:hypothetical protein